MLDGQIVRKSLNYYLLFFLFAVPFTLVFQGYQDFLLSLTLPFFDILFLGYYYRIGITKSEGQFVSSIFLWSLFIRVIAVFIMGNILIHYNEMPFISENDDYNYQMASVEILNRWKTSGIRFYDDIRFSSDSYSGFPNFSAALMYIFGTSFWVPRLGNAFLSSFTVVIGYKIVKKYSTFESARFLGVLLCLMPFTIIFSSLQLKDTLLLFFTVLALYSSSDILESRKIIRSIILLIISFVGISFGRPATIVPIIGGMLLMIVINMFSRKSGNIFIKILVLVIVVFLLMQAYQLLSSWGFASMDDYFEGRSRRMSERTLQDTDSNIKNMGIAAYLGVPLYTLGGFFLPPALLITLEESINYSTWGVLQHFAFLPFLIPAMFSSFYNRKQFPIPFYLLLVYLLLRIGQANSLFTVFSPRQSLGTVFIMYLMLPMYQPIKRGWQTTIMIISIVVLIAYNLVRLRSHGLF